MLYGIKNAYKAFKTYRSDKKAMHEFDMHAAYVKNIHRSPYKKYSNILLHLVDIGDYLTFRNFLPYYHQMCGDDTLFIGNLAYKPLYDAYDRTFSHTLWLDKKTIRDNAGRKAWLDMLLTIQAEHVYLPAYNANGFPDLLSMLAFTNAEKIIPLHGGDSFQSHFFERYRQHTLNNRFIGPLQASFVHEFLRNKEITELLCGQKITLYQPHLPVHKKHSHMIVVFCGANHMSKIWPASHYAAVIRQIADACLLITPETVAQHIAASTETPCVVYSNGVNYYRFIKTPSSFSHMHHVVPALFINKGHPLWRFAPSSLVGTIQPKTAGSVAVRLLGGS
jgi:hypothetical protein